MPTLTIRDAAKRRHHRDKNRRHAIFKRYDEVFDQYEIDFSDKLPSGSYISSVVWTSHGPTVANDGYDKRATATLTSVAGSAYVDDETFTLVDSTGTSYVFEFDDDDDVVETDTLIAVDFTGGETAAAMATLITTAINNSVARITATDNEDGTVTLRQDDSGTDGNRTNSETVSDSGFTITNFAGGTKNSGDAKAYADIGPGTGLVECTVTYANGEIAQAAVRFRGSDAEDDSDDTTDYVR